MPPLDPARMRRQVSTLFQRSGVPAADADQVSDELIRTELMGVSSHGLIRVLQYLRDIEAGRAVPGAEVTVEAGERGCVVVDCAWNLGIISAGIALSVGMDRARRWGLAAVVTHRCNHAGRLGRYTETAAAGGLICIAGAAIPPLGHFVVPWGGVDGRLGTNPFAYGFPAAGDPIVADFATSVVPEGRVRAARMAGTSIPADAVIDADGNPTTDPGMFYGPPRGSLLPFGASVGYKGYALGLLVELLGGALAGLPVTDDSRPVNGLFFLLIDPTAFLPPGRCEELGQEVVDYMHSARPADGSRPVLVPGELERLVSSASPVLHVDQGLWGQLCDVATALDVDLRTAVAADCETR